jgi:hypothetical protein
LLTEPVGARRKRGGAGRVDVVVLLDVVGLVDDVEVVGRTVLLSVVVEDVAWWSVGGRRDPAR